MDTVLGVDACRRGWIGVAWSEDGLTAHFAPTIGELAELAGPVAVIAIDIPIGLPTDGERQADVLARTLLGPRQSSVFMTPVRAALSHDTHAAASTANRHHTGKGMSIQAYCLLPKIAEVDRWLPTAPGRVAEVHPEVSFAELSDIPLAPKKTWAGANQRMALLTGEGFDLHNAFGDAGTRAGVDDLLDAAIAAWTARRVLDGAARRLPEEKQLFDGDRRRCLALGAR
jgi:predicted RNase H-like nuclease